MNSPVFSKSRENAKLPISKEHYKEKKLQELNLSDDFLFSKVMSDGEVCKKVLEKILNITIERIEVNTTQKTIELLQDSKGVRLDVYVKDDWGTVYNCEMQSVVKYNLPKRCRYYQGSIDLDAISKGEDYSKLSKSFVIFICTFDPFGRGRTKYTFKETCTEDPTLLLEDETTKVFLNTKGFIGEIDYDLQEFLAYVENSTEDFVSNTKSELVQVVHKQVAKVKRNVEMEAEFMTLLMRDHEKREEGREEGREQTLISLICKKLQKGKSAEEIAETLEEDIVFVRQVCDVATKYKPEYNPELIHQDWKRK